MNENTQHYYEEYSKVLKDNFSKSNIISFSHYDNSGEYWEESIIIIVTELEFEETNLINSYYDIDYLINNCVSIKIYNFNSDSEIDYFKKFLQIEDKNKVMLEQFNKGDKK